MLLRDLIESKSFEYNYNNMMYVNKRVYNYNTKTTYELQFSKIMLHNKIFKTDWKTKDMITYQDIIELTERKDYGKTPLFEQIIEQKQGFKQYIRHNHYNDYNLYQSKYAMYPSKYDYMRFSVRHELPIIINNHTLLNHSKTVYPTTEEWDLYMDQFKGIEQVTTIKSDKLTKSLPKNRNRYIPKDRTKHIKMTKSLRNKHTNRTMSEKGDILKSYATNGDNTHTTEEQQTQTKYSKMTIFLTILFVIVVCLAVWKWKVMLSLIMWPYTVAVSMLQVSVTVEQSSGGVLYNVLSWFGVNIAPKVVVTQMVTKWWHVVVGMLAEVLYASAIVGACSVLVNLVKGKSE